MRVLVISDIHANLTAFEAVLADVNGEWEQLWFLGDLVGYGPKPNECAELLQKHNPSITLAGNHDWAVLDKLDLSTFNNDAQFAIRWTQDALKEETLEYLRSLPTMHIESPFTLVHASPRQPIWEYILDPYTAAINFDYFDTPYCLVGHTHVPVWFEELDHRETTPHMPSYTSALELGPKRIIINPGSVGQPRDSDSRAAYAILDTETLTWQFHRVAYDIKKTQKEMRRHKMPKRLVDRLDYGW